MNTDYLSDTAGTDELRKACAACPPFVEPILRLLRITDDPDERLKLKMRIAASVGNREVLADLFGESPDEFLSFYPDTQAPRLSTEQTIDAFIDRFGDKMEVRAEGEAPAEETVPVAAPAIDYAAAFLDDSATAEMPDDPTASMLDSFLDSHPAPAPAPKRSLKIHADDASPEEERSEAPVHTVARGGESSQLTESLAKIMIKNRNYAKALEIIEALRLNNPEKSIYFADQIRFLRKLILNEEKKING